jgi:O-antigen/teichoic acid export membrane protein
MSAYPKEFPPFHPERAPFARKLRYVAGNSLGEEPERAAESPTGNRLILGALLDQGVVSAGNFLTNVMLARSLPASQYGVFALFLDAILFLNSLQAALLIYPLTVRSQLMDDNQLRRCSGSCVVLTLLFALPMGIVLAAYGVFIGAASVAIWAVLGQTFWQCQETFRRALLARRSYSRALVGDCVSYIGQVVILGLLIFGHRADVSRAFMIMAGTSVAAALIQGFQLRALPAAPRKILNLGRSFWKTGRWVMVANLTNVITTVCCSFALARSHGDAVVGQFAAVSNLLRIVNPLFITLATLIVPAVALVSATEQTPRTIAAAWRVTRHYGLRGMILLLPYWLFLSLFPGHAIGLFYHGRPEYTGLEAEVRILVCISICAIIAAVMASLLNGLRRSRRAMLAQIAGAGACLVVTIPATVYFGLDGLLIGTLISNATVAAALIFFYLHMSREIRAESEPERLPMKLLVGSVG